MTGATPETESNLWPSVLLFSVTYAGISALVTAVLVIFDLTANSGVAVGVLVAATATAARKFVLRHHRALQRGEQLRFALLAFGVLILITLIQLAITVLFVIGKDELPALIAETKAGRPVMRRSSRSWSLWLQSSILRSSTSHQDGSHGCSPSGSLPRGKSNPK